MTAEVTIFSLLDTPSEIMTVKITNDSDEDRAFTPVAAIPIYARSADNLRDHRHVTSLLNRGKVCADGVVVKPTLSFDERGHQKNKMEYFVCGIAGDGSVPESFYPVVEDYIGEGGNFERPLALVRNEQGVPAGTHVEWL